MLIGVSCYIKNIKGKKDLIIVVVELIDFLVIVQVLVGEEFKLGLYKIQGIGVGFISGNLDLKLVDKVIGIINEEVIFMVCCLMEEEGILVGIFFGVVVVVVLKLQEDEVFINKNIVVILFFLGECYLSIVLFVDFFIEKEL